MIVGPRGLVKAACFYARQLNIDHLDFQLEIIRAQMCCSVGLCANLEDNHFHILLEPRRYGREDPIYEILAHEMVHLKQYVTGELVDIVDWVTMWQGELYRDTPEDYLNTPWEKEAFGRQKQLYSAWRKESNDILRGINKGDRG
jgi:hypothetical protein